MSALSRRAAIGLATAGPVAALVFPAACLGSRPGRAQGPSCARLAVRLGRIVGASHLVRPALGCLDPGAGCRTRTGAVLEGDLGGSSESGDGGHLRADRRGPARAGPVQRFPGDRGPERTTSQWSSSSTRSGWVWCSSASSSGTCSARSIRGARSGASSPEDSAGRRSVRPAPLNYPEGWGRWPATIGVLAFVWLELIAGGGIEPTPHKVAVATLIYSGITFVCMALFGVEEWIRRGEAFGSYFGMFSRLSVLEARDGQLGRRKFLTGPPPGPRCRGPPRSSSLRSRSPASTGRRRGCSRGRSPGPSTASRTSG